MERIFIAVFVLLLIGAISHQACYVPTPQEIQYQQEVEAEHKEQHDRLHADNQKLTNRLIQKIKAFPNCCPTPQLTPTPEGGN